MLEHGRKLYREWLRCRVQQDLNLEMDVIDRVANEQGYKANAEGIDFQFGNKVLAQEIVTHGEK